MCKVILDRGNFADFTSVSNVFIDEYMPKANGEFIKIYLHLLRLINSGNDSLLKNLSTEKIADKFNMLESDVVRALNYWSEQGLLSFSFNENVGFLAKASGETVSSAIPENTGYVIPVKKKYNSREIASFAEDERVKQLTFLAQTYLGKTLNSSDINSILYMLDGLGFETDFIEYIMETCISLGHKSLSYIEKQAVAYARKGISTIEDAKTDEKLRRAIFKSIYKIFGLSAKTPVKKDIAYVTKWSDQYGFSDEIIIEACNRTMEHTHTGSFQYADTILTNWFNSNARSMEAIEKLDAAHSEEINSTFKPKVSLPRTKKVKSFDQRTYDYDELEMKLIANRDKKRMNRQEKTKN